MTKKSIRELALAKSSGFRTKTVTVSEWDDSTVVLREPSAEAWLRWQDIVKSDNEDEQSVSERAKRNLRADVALFIDVLCDEDRQPVFTLDEADTVESIYGPVHSRLLKQALDLITTGEDTKKK